MQCKKNVIMYNSSFGGKSLPFIGNAQVKMCKKNGKLTLLTPFSNLVICYSGIGSYIGSRTKTRSQKRCTQSKPSNQPTPLIIAFDIFCLASANKKKEGKKVN